MACKTCKGSRILSVSGKVSDMCVLSYNGKMSDGYVPGKIGLGGGDYLNFNVCLDCGLIQGSFPVSDEHLPSELTTEDSEEES